MADNSTSSGPLASLITQVQGGNLSVSFSADVVVNADEFAYIERDCEAFKSEIRKLQNITNLIIQLPNWGLGESTPGLTSANTVVSRFRSKAQKANLPYDSDNNIHDILDQHYKIIDDLQTLHHAIAQQYCQKDEEFAAEYNKLKANMEKSPIGTTIQPGVTMNPGLGKSQ